MNKRVLIADDHPMFLVSAQMQVMRAFDGVETVAVESLAALLAELARAPADLVMMDFSMPAPDGLGRSGVDGVRRVVEAAGGAPVLVMSGVAIGKDVQACLAMGTRGFLPKTLDGRLLTSLVSAVMAGAGIKPKSAAGAPPLTHTEHTVLTLFMAHATIAEIARQVARTEVAVGLYLARAMRKLGVSGPDVLTDPAKLPKPA